MDFCVCDRIELNRTELNPYLAQTGAAVTMLFSKLIFLVGCSFGLAVGAFDPRTGPDENSADSREGDLEARMKERREYMEARRDDAVCPSLCDAMRCIDDICFNCASFCLTECKSKLMGTHLQPMLQ